MNQKIFLFIISRNFIKIRKIRNISIFPFLDGTGIKKVKLLKYLIYCHNVERIDI